METLEPPLCGAGLVLLYGVQIVTTLCAVPSQHLRSRLYFTLPHHALTAKPGGVNDDDDDGDSDGGF